MNGSSDGPRAATNSTGSGPTTVANAQECWRHNQRTITTKVLTFALIAFAASQFAGFSLQTLRFLISPANTRASLSNLDSFSPPSVATAILNQEVDRLLLLYTNEFPCGEMQTPEPSQLPGPAAGFCERPEMAKRCSGDNFKGMVEIHGAIQRLSMDLDRKFLRVYFREGSWDAFLDSYLRLLRTEPAVPDVVGWEWCALRCSQRCGRTEELVDALEHAVRFHPERKTRHGLRNALNDWRSRNVPNPKSTTSPAD